MADDRMPPLQDSSFQTPLLRFVNPTGHEVDFLFAQVGMQETVLPAGRNIVQTFVHVAELQNGEFVGDWVSQTVISLDHTGTAMAVGVNPPYFPNGVEFSRIGTDVGSVLFWTGFSNQGRPIDLTELRWAQQDSYGNWLARYPVRFTDPFNRYLTNASYSLLTEDRILFFVRSDPQNDPYTGLPTQTWMSNGEGWWCVVDAQGNATEYQGDFNFDPHFLPLSAPVRPCNDAYAAFICDYATNLYGQFDLRLRWYELRHDLAYDDPTRSTQIFTYPNVQRADLRHPHLWDTTLVGQGISRAPAWDRPGSFAYVAYVLLSVPKDPVPDRDQVIAQATQLQPGAQQALAQAAAAPPAGTRTSYVDCFLLYYEPVSGVLGGSLTVNRGATVRVEAAWRYVSPDADHPFVLDQEDFVDASGEPHLVLTLSRTEDQQSEDTRIVTITAEPQSGRSSFSAPPAGGVPDPGGRPAAVVWASTYQGRLVDGEPVQLLDLAGNQVVYLYYRQEIDNRSLLQSHPQATAALIGSDIVTPLELFHRTSVDFHRRWS